MFSPLLPSYRTLSRAAPPSCPALSFTFLAPSHLIPTRPLAPQLIPPKNLSALPKPDWTSSVMQSCSGVQKNINESHFYQPEHTHWSLFWDNQTCRPAAINTLQCTKCLIKIVPTNAYLLQCEWCVLKLPLWAEITGLFQGLSWNQHKSIFISKQLVQIIKISVALKHQMSHKYRPYMYLHYPTCLHKWTFDSA